MKYQIRYSDTALEDIRELRFVIRNKYKAPNTAIRYLQGLYNAISRLKTDPKYPPVQTSPFFLRYGANTRRINYKKMAIIYTVHGDIVYIHRILSGNLITSL